MLTTRATLVHKYDSPSEAVSFVLFQVDHVFTFQEGQFMMIEVQIGNKITKKPYSIATTNRQLQEEKLIGFVVKKTSEYGMSDWLTQQCSLGSEVLLKGPVGHYTDSQEFPNYLFISAGSGLSPNVGIFQHLVYESRQYEKIVNIFGERYYTHIIPEIENLFLAHGDEHIKNLFFLSQEEFPLLDHEDFLSGEKRLGQDLYLPGHVQDGLLPAISYLGTDVSCFVCGKPEMVSDVVSILEDLGLSREQITTEKY